MNDSTDDTFDWIFEIDRQLAVVTHRDTDGVDKCGMLLAPNAQVARRFSRASGTRALQIGRGRDDTSIDRLATAKKRGATGFWFVADVVEGKADFEFWPFKDFTFELHPDI